MESFFLRESCKSENNSSSSKLSLSTDRLPLKSRKLSPQVDNMKEFEDDLIKMRIGIGKRRKWKNSWQ